MMKNKILCSSIVSIFAIIFLMSAVSAVVTHTETFDASTATGTYNDGFFVGIDNITWNYEDTRNQYDTYVISGNGMIFRNIDGRIYSNIISGGISNFSVKLKKASATLGDRQVELFINGVSKGVSTAFSNDTIHTFTVNNINIEGNIVIEIKNIKNVHVLIDDLSWTEYTTATPTNIPSEITECSLTGNPNSDLRIKIDDVNVDGFGEDLEWLPLDEISVDIKVENKNSDDKIKDIVVGWGVYNKDTDEWYVDDEENDFDLKEKDDKTLTVTFKLDEDIDELPDGDYVLYVWANGELNDSDICASDSDSVDMIIESDFVVLNNLKFTSPVECGTELQILGDVWNIGDDDQEGVVVVIQNTELGITKKITIGDVNSFDKEKLDAIIQIPQDAKEKQYDFEFMVYDEDGGIYVNDYDDDESSVLLPLKVEGGCAVQSTASVSASLESGGKAGSELKIKATITNTGTKSVNYTLNAVDYSAWATLVGIEPQTLTLNAGESKEALLTFNVAKDVSGDKLFNLEILSGTNLVAKQPVSVPIESAGLGISGISLGNNWYLWLIGALNVILVVVIIIIAVRVAKK